jgi:hypothetical protein
VLGLTLKEVDDVFLKMLIISSCLFLILRLCCGPVAQFGWSVRLITERSRVQISPGPLLDSSKYGGC